MFGSSLTQGLLEEQSRLNLEHYGYNKLPRPQPPSIFKMLWTQITDFMVIILIVAAIVTAVEGEYKSSIVLFVVIALNIIIGFTQELKASKALQALINLSVPEVNPSFSTPSLIFLRSETLDFDCAR